MTVAGLDPGPEQSALVVWNGTQVLRHFMSLNPMLQEAIRNEPIAEVLVVERVESFGMAVGKEVFETVFWSGRLVETWKTGLNLARWKCPERQWSRLGRRDIKLHICGHARATDSNIRQALIDRIGPIGTKAVKGPLYGLKGHEFAALAVAVTYHDQQVPIIPSIADF